MDDAVLRVVSVRFRLDDHQRVRVEAARAGLSMGAFLHELALRAVAGEGAVTAVVAPSRPERPVVSSPRPREVPPVAPPDRYATGLETPHTAVWRDHHSLGKVCNVCNVPKAAHP